MTHFKPSKLGRGEPAVDLKKVIVAPKRSPAGRNFHDFLKGLNLTDVHKNAPRGMKNAIYGGRYVRRLWLNDETNTYTTLRCIQEGNPYLFEDVVIWGTYRFVRAHVGTLPATEIINWFRTFDLEDVVERAKDISRGAKHPMVCVPDCLSVLLASIILPKPRRD